MSEPSRPSFRRGSPSSHSLPFHLGLVGLFLSCVRTYVRVRVSQGLYGLSLLSACEDVAWLYRLDPLPSSPLPLVVPPPSPVSPPSHVSRHVSARLALFLCLQDTALVACVLPLVRAT